MVGALWLERALLLVVSVAIPLVVESRGVIGQKLVAYSFASWTEGSNICGSKVCAIGRVTFLVCVSGFYEDVPMPY